MKREILTRYDETAEGYEELYREEQELKYKTIMSKIHEKYEIVLDLGCGTGLFLKWLREISKDVVGVDISKNMLRKAKQRDANVILADAENLPFREKVFDAVFAVTVLQLIPDKSKAFFELLKTLKDKGLLVLSVIKAKENSRHLIEQVSKAFKLIDVLDVENVKDLIIFAAKR